MTPNEARTRKERIDPALEKAGWNVMDPAQVGREIPVDGVDQEPWNGVTDYCLYRTNGEVLAVVEAKRQSRQPNVAREQARLYVADIAKRAGQTFEPFVFLSNGVETYFWERDGSVPRRVSGFFSRFDLENRLFLRQNRILLGLVPLNAKIAGRPYQQEAIRRLAEVFEAGKRRALLVMATGTGKTRTTVGLVDLFLRANQARRVLFLADRDALVDQALTDGFQKFLPNEPPHRIWTHDVDPSKRLYVATLQTLARCFEQFSPAFFDLIIFDEAHRSIFNQLGEVMEYFDARAIGLTATPADFLDRNTFGLFDCVDKTPTFLYDYKQAVQDGYLVDFAVYQARTRFQRDGIVGATLSEEDRNTLIEQGIDPDELDISGSELEKTVSVKGTLREQWEEFLEVCLKDKSGQLPGKSIVFACSQKHAERLRGVFEEMYPQYAGLVEVITSDTERVRDGSWGDGLITQFKKNDFPRIAISVDMLDTGIDVPELVNLAFMKPVQSRIKLWQMIGRGTRSDEACRFRDRLPDGKKTQFKIIDFWQNDFDRTADDTPPAVVPVLVTIFNSRLKSLKALLSAQNSPDAAQVKADLRAMIARIPTESFSVQRVLPEIESAWEDSFWTYLTPSALDFLQVKVGPLLRFAAGVDVAAETFTSKVERLKSQILMGRADARTMQAIAEDASRLPDFVRGNPATQAAIALCLSPDDLPQATPAQLTEVVAALAPQMKNRKEKDSVFRQLDLPDFTVERGYIRLSEGGELVHVIQYRERVEKRIEDLVAGHPTIRAIQQGLPVSDSDLVALERSLQAELGGEQVELTTDNIRKAYGLKLTNFLAFLRHLLHLEGMPDYDAVVQQAFERHLTAFPYNADQIRFLRAVQSVFLRQRSLDRNDLYDSPALSNFGTNAVERFSTLR